MSHRFQKACCQQLPWRIWRMLPLWLLKIYEETVNKHFSISFHLFSDSKLIGNFTLQLCWALLLITGDPCIPHQLHSHFYRQNILLRYCFRVTAVEENFVDVNCRLLATLIAIGTSMSDRQGSPCVADLHPLGLRDTDGRNTGWLMST